MMTEGILFELLEYSWSILFATTNIGIFLISLFGIKLGQSKQQ